MPSAVIVSPPHLAGEESLQWFSPLPVFDKLRKGFAEFTLGELPRSVAAVKVEDQGPPHPTRAGW